MCCKPLFGLIAGLGWGSLCKAPERFVLLTSERQIDRRNLVSKCTLNKISMPKWFKTKFYED